MARVASKQTQWAEVWWGEDGQPTVRWFETEQEFATFRPPTGSWIAMRSHGRWVWYVEPTPAIRLALAALGITGLP